MLESRWLKIAQAIIARSDREHPLDAVLRAELKSQRTLWPGDARKISEAVFAYARWQGWLKPEQTFEQKIEFVLDVHDHFSKNPKIFSDDDLRAKAVPGWTKDSVDVSVGWLKSLQTSPTLWLRTRPNTSFQLAQKLGDCEVPKNAALIDAVIYHGDEDLFRTPEFHAGEFELQDINSQIVALLCAPQPGETWWDACAGEGGKTLHLADLMQNKGLIWASDRAEWRLKNLKRRTARAKIFNYRAALWDGGKKLPTKTKFDGILVDAPCSGVGTWQRNPHARWTTTPEDVRELAAIQFDLLTHVAGNLKPGGKLIYSVCTLTKEETLEVTEKFEKQFPAFQPLELKNPIAPTAAPSSKTWLWPQETNGNGMFIATWYKK